MPKYRVKAFVNVMIYTDVEASDADEAEALATEELDAMSLHDGEELSRDYEVERLDDEDESDEGDDYEGNEDAQGLIALALDGEW